ncbi:MAG: carboxymuconolactone decarboxylase family protein [Paracoccaceae bacterium]
MSHLPLVSPAAFQQLGLVGPARAVYRDMKFVPTTVQLLALFPPAAEGYLLMADALIHDMTTPRRLAFLVSLVSSRAAQCGYCTAHAARMASLTGVPIPLIVKAAALDFDDEMAFSEAERAAMRLARDGSTVPNRVTDKHFADLKPHFSNSQIIEIVSQIGLMGFLNRVNDTLASPLEPESLAFAEKHLAAIGWQAGKHAPTDEALGVDLAV